MGALIVDRIRLLTQQPTTAGAQPALSGALSRALCYLQGRSTANKARQGSGPSGRPRILCLQGSPDVPAQYIACMNSIFSAQVLPCPISDFPQFRRGRERIATPNQCRSSRMTGCTLSAISPLCRSWRSQLTLACSGGATPPSFSRRCTSQRASTSSHLAPRPSCSISWRVTTAVPTDPCLFSRAGAAQHRGGTRSHQPQSRVPCFVGPGGELWTGNAPLALGAIRFHVAGLSEKGSSLSTLVPAAYSLVALSSPHSPPQLCLPLSAPTDSICSRLVLAVIPAASKTPRCGLSCVVLLSQGGGPPPCRFLNSHPMSQTDRTLMKNSGVTRPQKPIDLGFVCSVCLSIFCEVMQPRPAQHQPLFLAL